MRLVVVENEEFKGEDIITQEEEEQKLEVEEEIPLGEVKEDINPLTVNNSQLLEVVDMHMVEVKEIEEMYNAIIVTNFIILKGIVG